MSSATMQRPTKSNDYAVFDGPVVDHLERALEEIKNLSNISWEFTEQDINGKQAEVLIVTFHGEEDGDKSYTFTTRKGARAFVDAYLLAYDHGFYDGKQESFGDPEA